MNSGSTQPIPVEGRENLWQENQLSWAFIPREKFLSLPDEAAVPDPPRPAENRTTETTMNPQKIPAVAESPLVVQGNSYGKRSFTAQFVWEGEVESIQNDKFRCLITPIIAGVPDRSQLEFTDFEFEDLANDADRSLVVPGAVFYWTVGRSRNAAGTVTNQSLVRFRRLAMPTAISASRAEARARELLSILAPKNE